MLIEAETSTDEDVVADSMTVWQFSPPYGTSSSYYYFHSSGGISNVPLLKQVVSMTVATFISIVLYTLPGTTNYFVGVLSGWYSYLYSNDPTTIGEMLIHKYFPIIRD